MAFRIVSIVHLSVFHVVNGRLRAERAGVDFDSPFADVAMVVCARVNNRISATSPPEASRPDVCRGLMLDFAEKEPVCDKYVAFNLHVDRFWNELGILEGERR